jgi:hypothetical protein
MPEVLPRLRTNLDFSASPNPEHPGLLVRDPFQYTDKILVFPPQLVVALELFDGKSTDLDLRQALVEITGSFEVSEIQRNLIDSLDQAGFLDNATHEQMRQRRHVEFASAPHRMAAHAGSAYPAEAGEMRVAFDRYMNGAVSPVDDLCAIAAPHVSPDGGWESYRDAYAALGRSHAEQIFVILGTSHWGRPNRFGLTRKNFVTPLGETRAEPEVVDQLAAKAPGAIEMEDYCHATEHSIEFQVAFLQHLYGPSIRVIPVLVGSFFTSIRNGSVPEADDDVARFLDALGELNVRYKRQLTWILGVDMAHIGRRYGEQLPATAYQNHMLDVAAQDQERIGRINAGDAAGFWELVRGRGRGDDELKWCGSAPLYTFLKAVPEARGHMLRYQHWQIDPHSVVSFAALAFRG